MLQRKQGFTSRWSESPVPWLISSPASPGTSGTPGTPGNICCVRDHVRSQRQDCDSLQSCPRSPPHHLGATTYLPPSDGKCTSSTKCTQDSDLRLTPRGPKPREEEEGHRARAPEPTVPSRRDPAGKAWGAEQASSPTHRTPHVDGPLGGREGRSSGHSPSPPPSLPCWSKTFLLTHLTPVVWFVLFLQRVTYSGGRDETSLTDGLGVCHFLPLSLPLK